jgi:hypothetical protein
MLWMYVSLIDTKRDLFRWNFHIWEYWNLFKGDASQHRYLNAQDRDSKCFSETLASTDESTRRQNPEEQRHQDPYWLLQINLSFANSYIWDYTPAPRPSWNSLCEADIGFRLPNNSRLFYGKRKRSSPGYYRLHRRQRLELYRNIEGLLDM